MRQARKAPRALVRLGSMLALVSCLGACMATSSRDALSETQQETAHLQGLSLVRFWGDEMTPDVRTAITKQFRQVRDAAGRGIRRSSTRRADYLAISGGGSNGAFAGGFLKGWSARGTRPEFEVVTGVSTGALAAPFAFLGPRYDGELEQIYTAYGDRDIMRSRGLFGILGSALYDNAPLRDLIATRMSEPVLDAIAAEYRLGRRLLVQTTNIDAQRPVIWDVSAIAASGRADRRDVIIRILLASAAIPAVFPPVRLRVEAADGKAYDELHVDGGVSAQVFFAPPDIGFADFERTAFGAPRQRSLYVIRNGRLSPMFETTERSIPIAQRAIETLTRYQGVADLNRLETLARRGKASLFYASIPESFDARAKSEFDRDYMRQLFGVGYEIGRAGRWHVGTPVTPALADRSAALQP